MTKKLKLSVIMIACLALLLTFTGCASKENKEVAGKYNLTKMTCVNLPDLNASLYEYNYIILKENGKYEIENKAAATTISQVGSYVVDGTKITFMTRDGCRKVKEEYIIENGVIKMNVTINNYYVVMELTKE